MDGAESLLDASAITIRDAQGAVDSANAAAGSTVQLIGGGLDAADTANSDLLAVLNNTYTVLEDVDALLRIPDTETLDQQLQSQIHRQLQAVIRALEAQAAIVTDPALQAQLQAAIVNLRALDEAVDGMSVSAARDSVLDLLAQVQENLRMAALRTNQEVNDYLHSAGTEAQASLRALQQLLSAAASGLNGVDSSLYTYADAVAATQPTLDAGIALADTVSGYLADMEEDLRRVTDSGAFQRFCELMESDSGHMADYLSSPVQLNTEIVYEIKDYGSAMAPYYVMLALFVGSLLTAVMIRVPVTQPEFVGCPAIQRYFGRFAIFFLMAMGQALVTAFGCLHFVGMTVAEPALFVLACWSTLWTTSVWHSRSLSWCCRWPGRAGRIPFTCCRSCFRSCILLCRSTTAWICCGKPSAGCMGRRICGARWSCWGCAWCSPCSGWWSITRRGG